jgi:hypothetical protein
VQPWLSEESSLWSGRVDEQEAGGVEAEAVPHFLGVLPFSLALGLSFSLCLVLNFNLKFYYAKKKILITSKYRHMHGVLNVDEIKN